MTVERARASLGRRSPAGDDAGCVSGDGPCGPAREARQREPALRLGCRLVRFLLAPATFFVIAVLLIGCSGRWRGLVAQLPDPAGLLLGLGCGVPLYLGSLVLVQRGAGSLSSLPRQLRRATRERRASARRILTLGGRALYEEAFWRGTLQALFVSASGGRIAAAVLMVASLFTLRHVYLAAVSRRALNARLVGEFFLFSLALGGLWAVAERLLLVVGAHWMRNLLLEAGLGSEHGSNR